MQKKNWARDYLVTFIGANRVLKNFQNENNMQVKQAKIFF